MTALLAKLDHLGFNSPDPQRFADFYSRALGMRVRSVGESLLLEADDRKLIVTRDDSPSLSLAGFCLADQAALAALVSRLERHRWPWQPAPEDPFQSDAIRLVDPDGNTFVFGLAVSSQATFDDPVASRRARLQHVVFGSRDAAGLARFYEEVLGFTPTDVVVDDEGIVRTTFLRCSDEHHSLAVFQTSQDRFDHCSYEAGDWALIRDWGDHMASQHIPIKWGPGRHGPGNNLFMFIHDLDGNWVEISAELEIVAPDQPVGTWPHEERTLNSWGIGMLRS
jgi:catechol 2,3-dioxygenase